MEYHPLEVTQASSELHRANDNLAANMYASQI